MVYTVLRVAVFGAVWALLWLLTPLDALWSAVVALLVSGAISLVLLDRQRGRVGAAAGGFFARMNERIDAATRAEDIDDPVADAYPVASGQREQKSEEQAVGQQEQPGGLERGYERGADGSGEDDPQR